MSNFVSPVYNIIKVPVDKINAITYSHELLSPISERMLFDDIWRNGFLTPVICYYNSEKDIYVMVDGFDRYKIITTYKEIYERENGMLPVSLVEDPNKKSKMTMLASANAKVDPELIERIEKIALESQKESEIEDLVQRLYDLEIPMFGAVVIGEELRPLVRGTDNDLAQILINLLLQHSTFKDIMLHSIKSADKIISSN